MDRFFLYMNAFGKAFGHGLSGVVAGVGASVLLTVAVFIGSLLFRTLQGDAIFYISQARPTLSLALKCFSTTILLFPAAGFGILFVKTLIQEIPL